MNHRQTRFERSAEAVSRTGSASLKRSAPARITRRSRSSAEQERRLPSSMLENRRKRVAMTETLTYVAIYLLIGWLIQQVEDAIASTEDKAGLEETVRRLGMMYGEPTLWDRFVGKLYLLKYIVGWPYYLLRRLILIGL